MLLAIVISNLIWIVPACVLCGVAGYLLRGTLLRKLVRRVHELESEMLQNHAEILSLQKENTELVNRLKNPAVPVIPITGSPKENTGEALPDVTARKKMLGKNS
jgi:hypothetical protein